MSNESLTGLQWFRIHEDLNYNDIVRWLYDAFYELNIECDVLSVNDTDLFSQYKILVTPALYSVSDTLVTHLKNYVRNGGHLISTFKTAFSDPVLKIYADDQPHGLTEVFGMTYDQFTNPVNVGLKDCVFRNHAKTVNDAVHCWMELLIPGSAKTLASYDHLHWGSYAAITENHYGTGDAFYLGCYFDQTLLKELLTYIVTSVGIMLPAEQYPVVMKRGTNDYDRQVTYYFNYADAPAMVVWNGGAATLLMQDRTVRSGDTLTIGGWDFLILEEA